MLGVSDEYNNNNFGKDGEGVLDSSSLVEGDSEGLENDNDEE